MTLLFGAFCVHALSLPGFDCGVPRCTRSMTVDPDGRFAAIGGEGGSIMIVKINVQKVDRQS
jgi:hypothetical protein